MSGWIKWEKDLETDPRMIRLVRELKRTSVTGALHERFALTLACGALIRFWSYADSHIRSDDTIDLGLADIDDLVGIEGFAKCLPADWLRVIDDQTVELPNFQAHNNLEAKKKAQAQKRVEAHRLRKRNADVTQERINSVTGALPDQTRPDQTKTRPDHLQSEGGEGSNGKADLAQGYDQVNQAALAKYSEYCREKRRPLTTMTLKALVLEMGKHSHEEQAAAVDATILNNWSAVAFDRRGSSSPRKSRFDAAMEKLDAN